MKRLSPLIVFAMVVPAWGEVVHLKDGSTLVGELHKTDDGWVVIDDTGKHTTVPADRVESMEVRRQVGADVAMQRLASLRRAVDNLSDIKQILDRYRNFLEQNAGTPAASEAQADVDAWHDRENQGLVKVGDKWVSPDERVSLSNQSQHVAEDLRLMMKDGRLKQAAPLLDKALAADPRNPSLLYLRGILLYRQEQLPLARKALETLVALAPDHAPTLNNLAVIVGRQNAAVGALGYYDRAMLAAPASREILDNVAEALNSLPPENRKSVIATKVVRHFKEQEDDLQKKMAAKGLYRWGSSWVSEAQLTQLRDAEKQIKGQLDQMSNDFDAISARIRTIDDRIRSDNQEVLDVQSTSFGTTVDGKTVQLPLPARYYDLIREINDLKSQREQAVADQEKLRRNAKTLQQRIPVPKYAGIQRIIDVDGMPVVGSGPTPDTQPATLPGL